MLQYFSPAKINFFFHVIGKRSDGYHEIVSLLHTVSFGDYIHFTPAETDQLTIEGNPELRSDDTNLVIQALKLFRNKTDWRQPFHIHLQKNIPLGSGLGGGSSNAATTLWALNELSKLGIAKDELQKWSAELGSDVPFFFSGGCAVCRGRGEIVEDKPSIIESEMYLILNDENINTKKVFSQLTPFKEEVDIPKLITDTLEKKYPCINELEQAAFKVYPSLSSRKKEISAHCTGSVFMTGSGGSFVVIGRPEEDLFLQYPVIKKVECIEILEKGWYKDRKLIVSDLESKINALKDILPKKMSVRSFPMISRYAYTIYNGYLQRILEDTESSYDDFFQNRENCYESSIRSIQETYGLIELLINNLKKSISIKIVNEKTINFIKKAWFGTKYDKSDITPINVMEGIREVGNSWPGYEFEYKCSSEFTHPNGISIIDYVSPFDSNTEIIYFGCNTECNLEAIVKLVKILDRLINSYNSYMEVLDDFKNLCTKEGKD